MGDVLIRKYPESNYMVYFDRESGMFVRISMSDQEPFWNVNGPELVDISITNYCEKGCGFCYRASNPSGNHMQLQEYSRLMAQAKEAGVLQVALGGGNPNQHPDFINILKVTREYGMVPSYTTNGQGMTEDIYIATKKWGRLPILPEYLMINSGRIPEKGIEEFYDHYHMLQALRRDILGKGVTMDIKGDLTLDKRLTFKVYNRRWGHADTYGITRTVEGWNVSHITNGKSEKDGDGTLIANLNHDSIFFPEEGVKYALSKLWEQAEDGELTLSELQKRLQQVADWISIVEKAVGEGQPDWVGYY